MAQAIEQSALAAGQLARVAQRLFDGGHFVSAAAIYRYLLIGDRSNLVAWFWLGRCLEEQGNEEGALALFELGAGMGAQDVFDALVTTRRAASQLRSDSKQQGSVQP